MTYQPHQSEELALKVALKQAIEAMSPEERKAFAMSLCSVVDACAQTIVKNHEQIWMARHDRPHSP